MTPPSFKKPLGLILQEADLISMPQLEFALKDQASFDYLRLGEILALRGWIKQQTADFFAEQWTELLTQPYRLPIGYYLKAAGLLEEEQIETILFEQQLMGTKFGSTAVLKGWLKKKTIKFFLENLFKNRNDNNPGIIHYSEDFWGLPTEKTEILYIGESYIMNTDYFMTTSTEINFELIET